jgi:hypothetical protein
MKTENFKCVQEAKVIVKKQMEFYNDMMADKIKTEGQKRIEKLVKQATRPRGPNKPAELDTDYLAELIVQECAALFTSDTYIKLIKEHFGVK